MSRTTQDAWERRVDDIAELLVWSALGQTPTLGAGRMICVDGRAGSGKTTLGHALRRAGQEVGTVRLLHMDDLYEGWGGLAEVGGRIRRDLVAPLREGRAGGYHRYDWYRSAFAEWCPVEPVDLLVVEGVGSADSSYDDAITSLVWVEAPRELRVARGVGRDGEAVLPQWQRWMEDEEALFARERTRARADAVVDGTGESDRAVVFV